MLKPDVREMLLTVCVGERLSCPQNAQAERTPGWLSGLMVLFKTL